LDFVDPQIWGRQDFVNRVKNHTIT
jgi:hypothetical protein